MTRINSRVLTIVAILLACFGGSVTAQRTRDRVMRDGCSAASGLNGVYRIDVTRSDKLYSVIEGASSNVPYGEQQLFFIDLAVRLTPPDLLAIECRGSAVSLGSSRAPRVEFQADGVTRSTRNADGRVVRSRIRFERNALMFNSSGDDTLSFAFMPLDGGRRLRVTRRISAEELIEPVVIQTFYTKIADVARWDIFDGAQVAGQIPKQDRNNIPPAAVPDSRSAGAGNREARTLRESLNQWIAATNRRDIGKQMSFYMPELQAFYLSRNASRDSVRIEKTRAFRSAKSIDIRAEEPEIIFQDAGRTAIMRFRKKYRIEDGSKSRQGEVVQELRWRQTSGGWRIFSERDVRVIR